MAKGTMKNEIRTSDFKWMLPILCMAGLLLWATPGWGQTDAPKNELTFGLIFRTHGEIRGGGLPRDFDADVTPDSHTSYIMGRTRIMADYKSKLIDAKVTLQNQASWGAKGNDAITMYETWVKLKSPWGLFGQIGRMPLVYDDERILGLNEFAMAKLCHDVLRVGYEGHGHKIHAILAYNQNNDNKMRGTFYRDGAQPYKTMQTLWYHYDIPKTNIGASLLFMNIGKQAGEEYETANTEYQQLLGTYLTYSPHFLLAELAYYHQLGHNEYSTRIDAWMMSSKLTVKPSDRYGVVLGYEFLSGDKYVPVVPEGAIGMPYHDVIRGFMPTFGDHHKFYGILNYFYESAYSQGFTPGLQNTYIGGYYRPTLKLSLKGTYHFMTTATKLENLSMALGHDFDLEVSYQFNKDISLTAGFSYMIGTKTLNELKQRNNDKHVQWGWFTLLITPKLFSTKW